MKLFTKYIPVKGEVQAGDRWGFTYEGKWTISPYAAKGWDEDDKKEGIPQFDPECVNPTKVKLLVCSRDIHTGDKVRFQLTKKSPWHELDCIDTYAPDNTVILQDEEHTYHTSPDSMNQCFKVLGKVSDDAIEKNIVQGEMEVREDQVRYFYKHPSDSQKDFDDNDLWESMIYREHDRYTLTVKFKCPCCGDFK